MSTGDEHEPIPQPSNSLPKFMTKEDEASQECRDIILSLPAAEDSATKIVYLCRNPKDNFVSLWHVSNKLIPAEKGKNSLEESFDRFCKGVCACGPFWDHVLGYWKASLETPDKVIFLKYEEMKEQPTFHLRRLAQFLVFPFEEEEESNGLVDYISKLCSFDNLSNLEVNKSGTLSIDMKADVFFRRGEIGDWMNHLTADMVKRIDQITEQKLHGSGLKF
ncbi:Sulfotransferase [Melia azedarach]|uniref:Sulfotransferase n=1 Tax=Melia azedarach TaxID=155640 RepID=A0ACC1XHU0_MELAZ|nr:Sulfotransferase [Melia azedarach]